MSSINTKQILRQIFIDLKPNDMKSILVPVDFANPSEQAAHYAFHLARYFEANLILCHAIYIPVEVPTEAFGSWPGYDFTTLKEESTSGLEEVASRMRNKLSDFSMPDTFQPEIKCIAEAGGVTDIITKLGSKEKAQLIVMGMTGAGPVARFLFGSISRSMIDITRLPLILVPEGFLFTKIKKIAFATSLVDDDIEVIHALSAFARYFDADLLVAYVSDRNDDNEVHQKKFDRFLSDVTCKINYDKIYFRHVDKAEVNEGLDWLTEHGLIDLLVMVHRRKGLLDSLFSSHTHERANHLNMPLLIMPNGLHPVF
jgi:nucleotide-binding universal stress UspA family protein